MITIASAFKRQISSPQGAKPESTMNLFAIEYARRAAALEASRKARRDWYQSVKSTKLVK